MSAILIASCSNGPDPESLAATYVAKTAVAQAAAASSTPLPTVPPIPTDTSLPTATPTPLPTDTPTPTSTATVTETPDLASTRAAESTEQAANLMPEIEPVLEQYNLLTETGRIGWVQEKPIELYLDTYGSMVADNLTPINQEFSDFVLSIDVTWSSKSGLAGCGLIFLAEKQLDYGEQYRFYTMRFSGLPAWDIVFYNYDEFQYSVTGDIRFNNAINLLDDSTNNYVLIHKDRVLSIYANGIRLGILDITSRNKGIFGIFSYQESGKTSCIFDNTWVWELK